MKKLLLGVLLIFLCLPLVKAETADMAPNAKSAILIEASTGQILYEKNSHIKLAPASMTKMMSMLLIIENIENGNLKWDENVKVSANAASMGGSQIFLEPGETMSVEDLFKGIAIGSANDATMALAERIAGTESAFVDLMNKRARELGLKDTNFKNCHGLDVANHYSSAYDMAMIAKELVKHKKVLEFSSIYETYLREDKPDKFWLVNTNKLIRFYNGADGLKTGYTTEAGYCLTATANKNNMRLIAVVMGEADSNVRNNEVSAMLDYGYNLYSKETIIDKDSIVGTVPVEKGKYRTVDIVPAEEVSILYKKGNEKKNFEYKLNVDKIEAPVKAGDVVGKINVLQDGEVVKCVNATVARDVGKANIFELYVRYFGDIIKGEMNFR